MNKTQYKIAYRLARIIWQEYPTSYLAYCELCFSHGICGPAMQAVWDSLRARDKKSYTLAQRLDYTKRNIPKCLWSIADTLPW